MYYKTQIYITCLALFSILLPPNPVLAGEKQFKIQLVKDINPGFGNSQPHKIIDVSSSIFITHTKAYFIAAATGGAPNGYGLWMTDGTEGGTRFVADIDIPDIHGNYTELTDAGDKLFFSAAKREDNELGRELYASDYYGIIPGIHLVRDIRPGSSGSYPENLTYAPPYLLFFAYTDNAGRELWRSDGTASGTVMVTESYPGPNYGVGGFITVQSVLVNGILYYDARVPTDYFNINTNLDNSQNAAHGPVENYSMGGYELWRSDGTEEGTYVVKDLTPTYVIPYGSSWSKPTHLTYFKNALFYSSIATGIGQELFYYDPTNEFHSQYGPQIVKDICPNDGVTCGSSNSSNPSDFYVVGDLLYFLADDGIHGRELWVTNGTEAGTKMVIDLVPGAGSPTITNQTGFLDGLGLGGILFFVYDDGDDKHGRELWRTSGTAETTVLVKDIATGVDTFDRANNSDPDHLTVVGSDMYFSAWSPEYGRELWKTDGRTEGTRLVQEMYPLPIWGGVPSDLANVDGTLFFNANSSNFLPDNPYTGRELWRVTLMPSKNGSILNFLPVIIKKK